MRLSAAALAIAAAGMFALPPAAAQVFPSRPIRLVVPWPPGGISDTSARILAQHMSASVGQPVIVDNRAGAGSTIGTDLVAKSSADGYTLLYADVTTTAINATAYPKLAYDTLKDLAPVSMVGASPLFLTVHADEDFVMAARAVGGMGYVVKPRLSSDLTQAVAEARAGRSFVSKRR